MFFRLVSRQCSVLAFRSKRGRIMSVLRITRVPENLITLSCQPFTTVYQSIKDRDEDRQNAIVCVSDESALPLQKEK